jgi:hypothetical protein
MIGSKPCAAGFVLLGTGLLGTGLLGTGLLGTGLLVACGATSYRVEELPKECSPGEEVVKEVTKECGDQHCTCTSAGEWRCISPPCTPTMGIPPAPRALSSVIK